jgi:hypothetical protein
MAKDLNIQFSGRIGPLVGCRRYGKYYYRCRPAKVHQTEATMLSSNNFGLASKAGKLMRLYLAASIPNIKDKHMQKRLAKHIASWLGLHKGLPPQPTADIPFVNRFNFNPEEGLEEKLKIAIGFSQTGPGLTVLQLPCFVPAYDVKAPSGTTHLEFCINAVALRPGDDGCYGSHNSTITIVYDNSMQQAQQVAIPLQTQPGNMLITAMQLRYGVQEAGEVNYRKFAAKSAAAIVGAVYL